MITHSIRLKAPWLVGPAGTEPLAATSSQSRSDRAELATQIEKLVAESAQPIDVWAIRRFHRPTGLSANSQLKIAVTTPLQPARVSWSPLAPGDHIGGEHRPLELCSQQGNRAEYRLPFELPLRSELRLGWSQLEPSLALGELSVELVICEPD
jgi:hypothetical protein